ncbi:hypothetical protein ACJIZ3_001522 [Penstemon smallii]|uniref:Uncharacterized protein n=1 Tax=Penstemon smallii TaxID=265156 RepID=A0ABD3U3U1_9LAMI
MVGFSSMTNVVSEGKRCTESRKTGNNAWGIRLVVGVCVSLSLRWQGVEQGWLVYVFPTQCCVCPCFDDHGGGSRIGKEVSAAQTNC